MSRPSPSLSSMSLQEKRDLLEKLLKEKAIQGSAVQQVIDRSQIRPVDRGQKYFPLSSAQQRMWFLDQMEPGNPVYNLSYVFRLQGQLDIFALEQSLSKIMQRHEILRVNFTTWDGEPVQVLAEDRSLSLSMNDLSDRPVASRLSEADTRAKQEARRSFDLAHDALIRANLFRLAEEDHLFQFVIHHIVFDGWSLNVFLQELTHFYATLSNHEEALLSTLPIQYIDFASWEAEKLKEGFFDEHLTYWKEQLGGDLPILEMPLDKPRPEKQSFGAVNALLDIPPELTQKIHAFCRQEGVTLYMTMLSVFYVLLARHTAQEDIIVGTPIARRIRSEAENLIGVFINNLALRTDLSGNVSFRELLKRTRRTALDAFTHQDIPFERLLVELHPERSLNRSPFFQIFFNLLDFRKALDLKLPGLRAETTSDPEVGSIFDITLYVQNLGDILRLKLVYNSDLFDKQRMAEFLPQYCHLLSQILDDPDERIGHFSLVTDQAKEVLPDPAQPLSTSAYEPVHSVFSRQALRVPEHLALADRFGIWTYQELDRQSNQLANYLVAHGIQPHDVVAVYGHRSAALVWALLGILKAGAAFAILDPAYPSRRLIDYLQTARPTGWLQLESAGELPDDLQLFLEGAQLRCELLLPATHADANVLLESYSADPSGVAVAPDDLAYVAFTSGSTGKPKGILGTHRPLSHFLHWHTQTFGLTETDRFSMLSGLAHDPLLRDIFAPLWLGASLFIPEQEQMLAPGQLAAWMKQQCISVVHLTPTLEQVLTDVSADGPQIRLVDLRYAFFGGEPLTQHHVLTMKQLAPNVTCVNFYGATETPQAMGFCLVEESSPKRDIVPLGRGIEDVQMLLLNTSGTLAGMGEVGEIYIRTPYLSQGYLEDESLTQQRFLPNPFTNDPMDRLYRTGDLGRYLPNGEIQFIGRNDDQVKIRGFRIELSEIEAALLEHPFVQKAVATVWGAATDDKRLIAYLVLQDSASIQPSDLRSFLTSRLPDYMVPASFVTVDAIPLTPNGKVDRKALPAPDLDAHAQESFTPPQTETEKAVAQIWSDILKLNRVGLQDNFFELGGHSILATQVASRLRKKFQIDISLRDLFVASTVAQTAELIERISREGSALVEPIPTYPRQGTLPLSYAQLRLWLLDQFQPGNPAYNISGAIRLTGRLNVAALELSLTEIVRRHEALRTTFSVVDEQPVQVIHPPASFPLPLVDLSSYPDEVRVREVRKMAAAEALCHLDLTAGPLLRATLYRVDEANHILFFVAHHIVSDGWSSSVIIHELQSLYPSFVQEKPSPLPEPAIQYIDYADWQRTSIESGNYDRQLAYWKQQLAGSLPILVLPLDHPRPEIRTYRGATLGHHIPSSLIEKLKGLSQNYGTTLFMVLLGAFNVLLHRSSAQDDVIVGSPIANRNRLELEGLVGCLINMLALRTDLSGNPSFRELLIRVQRTALAAYENQDLPIEILTKEIRPVRVQDQNPLFQVSFIYQNLPSVEMTLGDLQFSRWEIEKQTSTLDLSLYLWEEEDGILARMEYDSDIFDELTIKRMLLHYQTLLEGIVANPHLPILELPLLTQEERHQLLIEWNANESKDQSPSAPELTCIHHLFEAQVKRTPDALALVSGAEHLTYHELNSRANQLAHYLQQMGVGPEVCVGLFVERSTEMIIGLLAVLKAGGAYIALDPAYPKERLAYMIQDTQAPVILTQASVGTNLPEYHGATLYLDTDWKKIALEATENPISSVTASNMAYIVYTSGSTGNPKGVMIEHRSLVNYIESASDEFEVKAGDRVLQFASINFDTSAEEIYPCLTRGATLVLRTHDMLSSAATFLQKCREWQLTILDLPTAYWHELTISIAQENLKVPESLRLVIIGGEKAIPEHIRTWRRCVDSQVRLVNTYGPTEGTIVATLYDLSAPRDTNITAETLIGRPVRNVQAYILDANLQPVPIGVPGELHLAGAGLARGYLNSPEITNQKFIRHPFRGDPKARLYKTGDLVRYVPDGNIEFLGRVDHQVKIRGFRVELGEIESALSRHPAVRENMVVAREDEAGRKSLVAYFTVHPGYEASGNELRQFIKQHLPEYMMPSSFVLLDQFPLTPNGKLDRKALPAPDQSRPELDHQYVAPRDEIEEGVTNIFASVLKLERVGIQDNFFELGGHSLLATQVISRLRQEFQLELPLRVLFEAPTPEGLGSLIMKEKVEQIDDGELTELLSQLENLSTEEAQALLSTDE